MKLLFLLSLFCVLVVISSASQKARVKHKDPTDRNKCFIRPINKRISIGEVIPLPGSCGTITCLKDSWVQYEICDDEPINPIGNYPDCCKT